MNRPPPIPGVLEGEYVTLGKLKSALDAIPNAGLDVLDYDQWRNAIFGIHWASHGADEGLALAHQFSAKAEGKYAPEFLDNRVWPYIRSDREDAITCGTIFKMAKECGWEEPPLEAGEFEDLTPAPQSQAGSLNLDDLFSDLALTQEDVETMADAEFLIDNLIVRGSLSVFVAPANGGKTTLFIHLCEEMAAKGLNIYYINADASPSDLKRHFEHAKQHGYTVLAPDAKIGKGPQDIVSKLTKMNTGGAPLDSVVIILDTLKKFTTVINKTQLKNLLALLRGLSTKGTTVIMLAHTNKYAGDDGKHIFEGTGDLRNDVDNMIYLEGSKDEAKGRQEITTRPNKVRANFKPVSYWIDLTTRKVHQADRLLPVIDNDERKILEFAAQELGRGQLAQYRLMQMVKEYTGIGEKKVIKTLHKLAHGEGRVFDISSGSNNARIYSLRGQMQDATDDLAQHG